jgi:cardiolipin synthase
MKRRNYFHTLATISLLSMLSACQTPTNRNPSSTLIQSDVWSEMRDLKQRQFDLGAQSAHYSKKNNESMIAEIRRAQELNDDQIKALEPKLAVIAAEEKNLIKNDREAWRQEKERISLSDISLYTEDKNVVFSVSTHEAKETEISLKHLFFTAQKFAAKSQDDAPPVMNFKVVCDSPVTIKHRSFLTRGMDVKEDTKFKIGLKQLKANQSFSFNLGDAKISNDYRDILIKPGFKSCDFKFTSSLDPRLTKYGFKIVNEDKKMEVLKHITSTAQVCTTKKDPTKFFETAEFTSMSCASPYESIQMLPEPEDSLYARVKSLLGQDLPEDFIKNGNPYAPLDFSKAPKFDAILVSYLVFRADFYGTLMGRLLAYHADRGAIVRAIVSEVITLDKDEKMYERLMAKHPNIKFIQYKFDNKQKGGAWISEFHRTNHVKLFIAYSKENPKDSMVIVGGKNIHDGFVFKTPVDVSKFPEIVNYVEGDESWAYWRDFEMVIKGQSFIEDVVRHYMSFYHINKENLVMKITNVPVQVEDAQAAPKKTMRHYVSIPFKDEPNLNIFYARLIDSAKKSLLISSPYFRPVKEIADALERAVARGVDVSIITRLDLEGDTADFILGAVNKDGVNQFYKKVKVYEYIEPKVILHSKLVMVDDEISFISSVNLNKRSFYHDLENGVVVNDPSFTKTMSKLYSDYLKISKQLTEEQKIVFWKRWIIKIFDKVL